MLEESVIALEIVTKAVFTASASYQHVNMINRVAM